MNPLAATEGLSYHFPGPQKKPTIIIIPSLFHTPAHFGPLTWYLQTRGSSSFALRMPSSSSACGASKAAAADTSTIQRVLSELVFANEEDVVLVMHAYGAVPGSQAVAALAGRLERGGGVKEEGKMMMGGGGGGGGGGGVRSLVLIGGWMVEEGESIMSTMKALGEEGMPGYVEVENSSILQPKNNTTPSNLFSDLPPHKAAYWTSQLDPQHSLDVYTTPVKSQCWDTVNIPTTYISCTKDPYVRITDAMLAKIKKRENWTIKTIEAGHAPFLSRVEEVGDLILEAGREGGKRGVGRGREMGM